MRIAIVSTPFVATPPRDYGGTELIAFELTEGLVARGHDVTLFATGDSQTSASLRALYERPQWPPDPVIDLDHVSWALHQVAQEGYDLVHVHSACALALARLRPGLPIVYTLHHPHEPTLSTFYRHMPDVQYVAISAYQRSREPELARCRVIHHGLDPARYTWTDRPHNYACFVGRLAAVKGAHIAIDVAAAAGVPIQVAGPIHPPDRSYVNHDLEHRLALPHARYLGPVDMAAKVPLLRDARVLLAPITWDEPFGLILIEAMLSGCPVVAFPRGSVPELVEPGVTGLVVETPEAMAAAIAPGGPVDRLSRRQCRLHAVQRFSRSRFVTEHECLYTGLLAEQGQDEPTPVAAA